MRAVAVTLAVVGCLFGVGAQGQACDYPEEVNVPDGRNATKEEMVAGQKAVKSLHGRHGRIPGLY